MESQENHLDVDAQKQDARQAIALVLRMEWNVDLNVDVAAVITIASNATIEGQLRTSDGTQKTIN